MHLEMKIRNHVKFDSIVVELGHEDVNYWLVVVQTHSSAKKGAIHNLLTKNLDTFSL